ncbi:hypothetical protein Bca52824_083373 [Brassica carinata]|uniref:Uncharacterized protein n=1 Tax=Brassica carinata TaxID=52824 RepID=A0A8X7PLL5_BRACI|nr:hypothetical protein Bca52824_083373 [Brassica carinata]
MVISQAEESDFRALQEAPYASWRGSSAWRRFGDSSTDSSAVFGLSVVLGEGRAVAVLCSLMGVQLVLSACVGARGGLSRSAAPERCWRRRLWRLQGDVVAFLSIFLPLPVCLILATGLSFRRQKHTFTRFLEEATDEGLEGLCLSAGSPLSSVAWSVVATFPSTVSIVVFMVVLLH